MDNCARSVGGHPMQSLLALGTDCIDACMIGNLLINGSCIEGSFCMVEVLSKFCTNITQDFQSCKGVFGMVNA